MLAGLPGAEAVRARQAHERMGAEHRRRRARDAGAAKRDPPRARPRCPATSTASRCRGSSATSAAGGTAAAGIRAFGFASSAARTRRGAAPTRTRTCSSGGCECVSRASLLHFTYADVIAASARREPPDRHLRVEELLRRQGASRRPTSCSVRSGASSVARRRPRSLEGWAGAVRRGDGRVLRVLEVREGGGARSRVESCQS